MSAAVTFALPPARKPADAATLRKAVARAAATLAAPAAEHAAPGGCGCDTGAPAPCPKCAAKAWAQVPLGAPNDPLEAEADRMADALDRRPTTAAAGGADAPPDEGGNALGRLTEHPLGGAPAVLGRALSEGGQALPAATRAHFESAFGYDFSRVRVHAGSRAGAAARALSSRAFTWGQHVAFAPGQYAPHSAGGRHLLAHELTHVVQQSGAGRPAAAAAKAVDEEAGDGVRTRCTARLQRMPAAPTLGGGISAGVLSARPQVQRDFALEPPRPAAVPRVLTPQQMLDAIAFNERVVTVIGVEGIAELRDVLGIARAPAVIDQEFVEAVQRWQAMQGIGEDGRLGPESAGRLFVEIGAEQVGRAELASGPTYRAAMSLTPPVDAAGQQTTGFSFSAEFKNDPVNGVFASCGEVRQFIQWDAASAAALPGGRPHAGFPAGSAAGTWIEDRDTANLRYGHRRGRHAESIAGNSYIDTRGNRNAAFGHIFRGRDFPGGPDPLLAGQWRFFVRAFDVCNGNKVLGTDFLRITW
jgi:hypothetical protein